ncbi:unnamed protein product [Ectocarpus fasciculatus]
MRRQELEELFTVWQAKLLHPLDRSRWTSVLNTTVASLLSAQPLQCLTKRGRLAVVMCIVGSGRTGLFSPAVLAVLACDWVDDYRSFKLLQNTVRQASLSRLRSECVSGKPPPQWSQEHIADFLEEGLRSTISGPWRALGIKGSARERVDKISREIRGLAARCREACDRSAARKLLCCYLDSNRLEDFVDSLVPWGQEQLHLGASKPSIFEEAFPFLEGRQIQASRSRADQMVQAGVQASKETSESRSAQQPSSPNSQAVCFPLDATDDQESAQRLHEGRSNRKRRKLGILRLHESVCVKEGIPDPAAKLWRPAVITKCRGDGTYDVAYEDGEADHLVRRADIFEAEGNDVPTEVLEPQEADHSHVQGKRRPSQAAAGDIFRLPPSSKASSVSEAETAAEDELWSVTDVDGDFDASREGGTSGSLLIKRRNNKRRILEDDDEEGEEPPSAEGVENMTTVGVLESQSIRCTDAAEKKRTPPLGTDQENPKGAADSRQAREQEKDRGQKQLDGEALLLRDSCTHQEVEPASPFSPRQEQGGGAEGEDEDEVETDEELTEKCEEARAEKHENTDKVLEKGGQGGGDRIDQQYEEPVGDVDVVANRMQPLGDNPSEARQNAPNGQKLGTERCTDGMSLLAEGDRGSASGAPTTSVQSDKEISHSQESNDTSPRHEEIPNAVVDHDVVGSPVGKIPDPTSLMRVYGSAGLTRVRKSFGQWFSQRRPTCGN